MNKVILTLFAFAVCSGLAQAGGLRSVPVSQTGEDLHSFDYGGVSYATSSFSSILATPTINGDSAPGKYTVYGAYFSTGLCGNFDRVDIFDSTGAWSVHNAAGQRTMFSVYNVSNSTVTETAVNIGAGCSGFQGLPTPVRFTKGLFWRPSSTAYNSIMLLYHKEGD